ncbi:MAG: hypothetical protein ACREFQ_19775 [Stellaceae bacterium]
MRAIAFALPVWLGIALSGCVVEPGYYAGAYSGSSYPPSYVAPASPYAYPAPFYGGSLGLSFGGFRGHHGFPHSRRFRHSGGFHRPGGFHHGGPLGFDRHGGHAAATAGHRHH